jgi:(1->4)-alpha-D-glucan 1-alpha-D-glucosylmutase
VAGDEINYRRFFEINELAALRMEREDVFEATHRLLLRLAADGAIDGLRVDHPDGLADPAGYFFRLQARYAQLAGLPPPDPTSNRPRVLPLYVVVEKIVAPHESIPRTWAVHGTTGYRFANVVNGLFVDSVARSRLERTWRVFVRGDADDFDHLAWECRHAVMAGPLAGELTVLATMLLQLGREDRRTRDFTLNSLRRALAEVVAAFPVYRTYVIDEPSREDRRHIDWAIGRARRRSLDADSSVFDFLRRVLLGRPLPGAAPGRVERFHAFTRRLQQYTAPVAAKGIEDTALYRHHRLVSLNDVGGDPDVFGISVAAFHGASRDRAAHWPATMLATSTHDGKRSEDVRCRIDVISEMPAAWRLTTRRWARMNRRHKRIVDGEPAPSRNDEYLLYQLLAGSLPTGPLDDPAVFAFAQRIDAAMLKSAREAKRVTSWMNPNAPYEDALHAFIEALFTRRASDPFLDDLEANAAIFAWFGALNGLTLALVKSLSPGVPDFYQGHEAVELSLVDPDNRRAVDFERRRAMLDEARVIAASAPAQSHAALRELAGQAVDGRAKFWVTWRGLGLRRSLDPLLCHAEYVPLEVRGAHAAHIVAYAIHDEARQLLVVGTRLLSALQRRVGEPPLGDVWEDTAIVVPAALGQASALHDRIGRRTHAISGEALPLREVLRDVPVAALCNTPAGDDDIPSEHAGHHDAPR